MFDDDDFIFDDEDFDEEEFERERKKEKDRMAKLPIVIKANDLFTTIRGFLASVEDEEDKLDLKNQIMADIAIINAKIAGAEAIDYYSKKMENAVLVKIHASSIVTLTHAFEMMDVGNLEYLELIRQEIESFRVLFVEWISTFDRTNDFPDEWGLFN